MNRSPSPGVVVGSIIKTRFKSKGEAQKKNFTTPKYKTNTEMTGENIREVKNDSNKEVKSDTNRVILGDNQVENSVASHIVAVIMLNVQLL